MDAKICTKCKILKWDDYFSFDQRNKDGLQSACKLCYAKNVLIWQRNFPEKHNKLCREHEQRNPGKKNARRMKYHASKLQRTPAWANSDLIKQIYINCPTGFQVDHIVPLQGEFVSGFHVEYNLQYLTKTDNVRKGNRYGKVCVS